MTIATDNFSYDAHKRLQQHRNSTAIHDFSYNTNGNLLYKTGVGNFSYTATGRPYAITGIANSEGGVPSLDQDVVYTSEMRPKDIYERNNRAYFNYGVGNERCMMELHEGSTKLFTRYYFAGGAYEETVYESGYEYIPDGLGDTGGGGIIIPPWRPPFTPGTGLVEITPRVQAYNIDLTESTNNINIGVLANLRPTGSQYRDRILYVDGSPYRAAMAYTPDRQNKHFYIHRDRQGSVRAISNALGVTVARYFYDAWGRQTDECGTPYAPYLEPIMLLGRGYTGHEHLPWFNLINMNARLYDPAVGRFLSPDPYVIDPGYLQDFNRYTYARNNPLMYVDEDGEWVHILIGAIIGGTVNLIATWDQVDGFWQGMAAFGAGAASGALTAGIGPLGALAGGAIVGGTNNIIAQTGHNFAGFNQMNWGQFGIMSGVGAISGIAGYGAGQLASKYIGGAIINGLNINSPVVKGAISGTIGGAAGGYAGGYTGGFLLTGDPELAHEYAMEGLKTGAGLGLVTGSLGGYVYAKQNGIDLWTGNRTTQYGTVGAKSSLVNLKHLNENYLRQNGIDAHTIKYEYLGNGAQVSRFNLYATPSGQIVIMPNNGNTPIFTDYFIGQR